MATQGGQITKPCDVCGTAVTRYPSNFHGERVYCSKVCMGRDRTERFSGENNPTWKGGLSEGNCNHCGKTFLYRQQKSERLYCSMACRDATARVHVPCAWCGTTKEMARWEQGKANKHFCNDDCRLAWKEQDEGKSNPQYRKITKPCDVCGTPVTRSPSGFTGEKVCCSKACFQKRMIGALAKENNPNWGGGKQEFNCANCGTAVYRNLGAIKEAVYCSKECLAAAGRVTVACNWCGAGIEMQRNTAERSAVHYCNRGCFAAWQASDRNPENQKVTATCTMCEQEFTASPSRFKHGKVHFCSASCHSVYQKQIKGVNHPNWRGGNKMYYGDNWKEQRQAALRRDHYRCQRCKRYRGQEGIRLQVHHKRKFRLFGYIPGVNENYKEANDLSNLITLCESCHSIVEPRNQYIK